MSVIKELVKDNKMADFVECRDSELWYRTREDGFMFPISFQETKGGTFKSEMKAIILMRYIRKHLEVLKEAQEHFKK